MQASAAAQAEGMGRALDVTVQMPPGTLTSHTECLGSASASDSDSGFLVVQTLGGIHSGSSAWAPATHVGDADGVLSSQLQPGQCQLLQAFGSEPADGTLSFLYFFFFCLFLCLSK